MALTPAQQVARDLEIAKNAGVISNDIYNKVSGGSDSSGNKVSDYLPSYQAQVKQPVYQQPMYQQPQNYLADAQKYIDQQFNQQLQARLQALQAAKQTKLSGLESQKGTVGQEYKEASGLLNQYKAQANPQFQNQRNQAQVQTAQAANKLKELMAARGVLAGGENISANVSIQNQLQNTMGGINQQQQDYMSDLDRRQADLDREKAQRISAIEQMMQTARDSSSAEELSAISDIGSQQSQALLNALNKNYDIQNDSLRNYGSYLDNMLKQSTIDQSQQKQGLVNKWLSGEGLSAEERMYLGIDNMETNNKDQYIQGIYAKLQQGQPLNATEQMIIGIYQKPTSSGGGSTQTTVPSITDLSTPNKQEQEYYRSAANKVAGMAPREAYQYLINNRQGMISYMGVDLYNSLLSKYAGQLMSGGH